MAWVDIDAKGGRAKKKPEAWSKGSAGEYQADHHHYDHHHFIVIIMIMITIIITTMVIVAVKK